MLRCCEKKGDKQLQSAYLLSMFCRDDQTRTGDLAPPRRVRYQLRQIPIAYALLNIFGCKGMILF